MLLLILTSGILAGCQGIAFSAEAAAQQQIFRTPLNDFQIDPTTYQVLQTNELGDTKLILASFQGTRLNSGRETCLFLYETFRMMAGWVAGSGGGGCSNEIPDPETRPVSIGVNRSSGRDQNDPGHSTVSGLIFQDDIDSVQVTWSDGQQQEASISNHSFLAARAGNLDFAKIEVLDTQGNIVFTEESRTPAPGKH